jgi:hypothetical protein
MVDYDAVFGQREQRAAIEDWHAPIRCPALDD